MPMPAKQGLRSRTTEVGQSPRQLAAGIYDLVALSRSGKHCARRVVLLAAGDLTQCWDHLGANRPMTTLPSGFIHDADTSFIETTVPVAVYF